MAEINGTSGDDTLTGTDQADTINGLGGNDTLDGGDGNDQLYGGSGIDDLYGGAGDDLLDAGGSYAAGFSEAPEDLFGGEGNDIMRGASGQDMFGGTGDDTYDVDTARGTIGDFNHVIPEDRVFENENEGNDTIRAFISYTITDSQHVETLIVAKQNPSSMISLGGNSYANTLIGSSSADSLSGGGGDDILIGGAGDDIMSGGTGSDTFYVDSAGDVVIDPAAEGVDRVAASVSYTLPADADIEILEAITQSATNALNLIGNNFGNTIIGNNGANLLNAGGGDDVLIGLGGDDTLIGGSGNDAMYGGFGNDTYFVDSAGDVVGELVGQGFDRVAATASYALAAGAEVEVLDAANLSDTTPLNLTGNEFDNSVLGNNGNNVLSGGDGNDTLSGYGGDDVLIGGAGIDVMSGNEGNDIFYVDHVGDVVLDSSGHGNDRVAASVSYTLAANAEIETLEAITLSDTTALDFTGNAFINRLIGNAGSNVLNGGGGNDVLLGLGGADTFAFTTALGSNNVDRIEDFLSGTDKIALDDAVFTAIAPGALAAGAFVTGSAAQDADDRIIYNAQTGALLYDSDGTGGAAAVQFATLQAGLPISGNDFLMI